MWCSARTARRSPRGRGARCASCCGCSSPAASWSSPRRAPTRYSAASSRSRRTVPPRSHAGCPRRPTGGGRAWRSSASRRSLPTRSSTSSSTSWRWSSSPRRPRGQPSPVRSASRRMRATASRTSWRRAPAASLASRSTSPSTSSSPAERPEPAAILLRSHAEDEVAFGRQEALQEDGERQAQAPSVLLVAHPREEVAEAQARVHARPGRREGRPQGCHQAAGRQRPMTRVKRSVNAKKKRRETLERAKGFRGEAHSSYRRAKEAVMKADAYAYRDRRNRKRDFRRLWIQRINAAARQEGMSYGTFMHGLKLAGIELDRKVLADIAVRAPETFRRFAESAREASAAAA